jgi:hypothetical protein
MRPILTRYTATALACTSSIAFCMNNTTFDCQKSIPKTKILNFSKNSNKDTLKNCCLLIPNQLNSFECAQLSNEADRIIDQGNYQRDCYSVDTADELTGLRRISISDMSNESQEISKTFILNKILPILAKEHPTLLQALHLENIHQKDDIQFDWASDEPSVNRYVSGGTFESHEDGYPLTVIVLLSNNFQGGGTIFWPEDSVEHLIEDGILVQPPVGTAMLFNGDITHAGAKVISGTRHLYVASFGIHDKENVCI